MSRNTPAMMVDNMYSELIELNNAIQSREPGKRFATREEADIRRKLLLGIRSIQQQQSAGSHMEVLLNFIEFLKRVAPGLTKEVALLADNYLCGEKNLGGTPRFQAYDLPTHETTDSDDETIVEQEQQLQPSLHADVQETQQKVPKPALTKATPPVPHAPLLHPITPHTAVWPPVAKKQNGNAKHQVPQHIKAADRQTWINYIHFREQFISSDKTPPKV
ncbi:MAG: hypothetical protein JSS96_11925 [Bacteroidetes bacterium]|nr:hypothetical protein [Bacteroidota bacterium]